MNLRPLVHSTLALGMLVSMSGCASIFSGSRKNVKISSNPTGARVSVTDEAGKPVTTLTTPGVAKLERGSGFFSGASYVATIDKPGYQTQKIAIDSTVNPWYFGNLLIGGIIGMFIVDPATGGMFTLTPAEIDAHLVPAGR